MNSKLSTSNMSRPSASSLCLLLVGLLVLLARVEGMTLIEQVDQSSAGGGGKAAATLAVIENPELVSRVLESLLRSIVYSASMEMATVQSTQKRGLDLGISRGFSGSQAGKHLMGLSAASFANGPGRR